MTTVVSFGLDLANRSTVEVSLNLTNWSMVEVSLNLTTRVRSSLNLGRVELDLCLVLMTPNLSSTQQKCWNLARHSLRISRRIFVFFPTIFNVFNVYLGFCAFSIKQIIES